MGPISLTRGDSVSNVCQTCRYHSLNYLMQWGHEFDIRLEELFQSAKKGCGTCMVMKGALQGLVLNSFGDKLCGDEDLFLSYDGWKIRMEAEWFGMAPIEIEWKTDDGSNSHHPGDISWDHAWLLCNSCEDPLSQATQWLESCINGHRDCNLNSKSVLPRRVLQIAFDRPEIKLVETVNKEATYAALSHCWGKSRQFTTTTATIEQHKLNIELSLLPKTFQDAIVFCQKLRIEYLWIDSLCIVQDDRADWELEAAKMGSIYENAFITLAAAGAADDDGGLFFETPKLRFNGITPSGEIWHAEAFHVIEHNKWTLAEASQMCPLATRGWVFQERILSRRMLHFGRQELSWECKEEIACECQANNFNFDTVPDLGPALERAPFDAVALWQKIIVGYTPLKLSVSSDKLPAISAIARKLAPYRSGQYLAGLWEDSLLLDLLWQVEEGDVLAKPDEWRAPSWSWASVDSGITYASRSDSTPHITQHHVQSEHLFRCRVLGALRKPVGLNDFGEVSNGQLRIEGHLVKLKFEQLPNDADNNESQEIDESQGWTQVELNVENRFRRDYELKGKWNVSPDEAIFCLRILMDPMPPRRFCYSIVLRPVDVRLQTFERIGCLVYRYSSIPLEFPGWWGDEYRDAALETTEITIV